MTSVSLLCDSRNRFWALKIALKKIYAAFSIASVFFLFPFVFYSLQKVDAVIIQHNFKYICSCKNEITFLWSRTQNDEHIHNFTERLFQRGCSGLGKQILDNICQTLQAESASGPTAMYMWATGTNHSRSPERKRCAFMTQKIIVLSGPCLWISTRLLSSKLQMLLYMISTFSACNLPFSPLKEDMISSCCTISIWGKKHVGNLYKLTGFTTTN